MSAQVSPGYNPGGTRKSNPLYASSAWRRRRQRWQARLPVPCLRCGQPIRPGDPWDL